MKAMVFLNTGLIFNPEVFILMQKIWAERAKSMNSGIAWNFVKEQVLN